MQHRENDLKSLGVAGKGGTVAGTDQNEQEKCSKARNFKGSEDDLGFSQDEAASFSESS